VLPLAPSFWPAPPDRHLSLAMENKRVRALMTAQPEVATARPDDDLGLAAQVMAWAGARHLPVLRGREVVGVLSERDIIRRRAEVGALAAAREPVERAMHAPAIVIAPDASVVDAIALLLGRRVGCLPVVGPEGLEGILTAGDVLRGDLEAALVAPDTGLARPVRSVMRPAPVAAAADTSLLDAAALMSDRDVRHLPVVTEDGRVVGILSDRDVRAAVGDPRRLLEDPGALAKARALKVGQVMSRTVIAAHEDEPLATATAHFVQERIGALPVVNEQRRLVGILSYLDVLYGLS
jgi:CBS domain-containing protein